MSKSIYYADGNFIDKACVIENMIDTQSTREYMNIYKNSSGKTIGPVIIQELENVSGDMGVSGNIEDLKLNAGLLYMRNYKIGFNDYTNSSWLSTGSTPLCINNVCSQPKDSNSIILCNVEYDEKNDEKKNCLTQQNITARYFINDIDNNDILDVLKNSSIRRLSSITNGTTINTVTVIIKSYSVYFNIALKNPNKSITEGTVIEVIVDGTIEFSYCPYNFMDVIPKNTIVYPTKMNEYMLYKIDIDNISHDCVNSILKCKIVYKPAINRKPYFIIKKLNNVINNLGKLV
jgi:hypothetical protein